MLNIQNARENFTKPLQLESGRVLSPYSLVYETYGHLNAAKDNVIVLCHALTGSHHAAGRYENDAKAGWWDALIGDDKAIDTNKFFVICVCILGSPFGSTSPLSIDEHTKRRYALNFPVLTISDVVNAQMELFKRLEISNAYAIIGGSLGGMQALCYAIEHPNFAQKTIMLASSYQTKAWAIAFNSIAIQAIKNDPEFKNGEYDTKIAKNGLNGLAFGRMAGHISFLSPNSMDAKFGRNYVETDGLYEIFGRFQVDRYMQYNGYNFAKKFDPLCYIYIAKMMNIFDCTRHYNDLKDALSRIKSQFHLISFSGDMLFPPFLMREIYECLKSLDKDTTYAEISSNYGHDAFLVEFDKFDFYIKNLLEG